MCVFCCLQILVLVGGVVATALQPLALLWRGAHTAGRRGVGRGAAVGAALVVGEHEVAARLAFCAVDGWCGGEVVGSGGEFVGQGYLVTLHGVVAGRLA